MAFTRFAPVALSLAATLGFQTAHAQALVLVDPVAVKQQVLEWILGTLSAGPIRTNYSPGGSSLAELDKTLANGLAEFRAGGQATVSGKCSILAVHEGQLFKFERAVADTVGEICPTGSFQTESTGPRGRVVRWPLPHATITSFEIQASEGVKPGQQMQAMLRIAGDRLTEPTYRIRLTYRSANGTSTVTFPPMTLSKGENVITRPFSAPAPISIGNSPQGKLHAGPLIVIADLTFAEEGRTNVLLANSVAAMVHMTP